MIRKPVLNLINIKYGTVTMIKLMIFQIFQILVDGISQDLNNLTKIFLYVESKLTEITIHLHDVIYILFK